MIAPKTRAIAPNMLVPTLLAELGAVVWTAPPVLVGLPVDELLELDEPVEVEELELLVPFVNNVPACTPPAGALEVEAFLARAMNASRVLPVVGALMEPTIPDWQWVKVVCAQ